MCFSINGCYSDSNSIHACFTFYNEHTILFHRPAHKNYMFNRFFYHSLFYVVFLKCCAVAVVGANLM